MLDYYLQDYYFYFYVILGAIIIIDLIALSVWLISYFTHSIILWFTSVYSEYIDYKIAKLTMPERIQRELGYTKFDNNGSNNLSSKKHFDILTDDEDDDDVIVVRNDEY